MKETSRGGRGGGDTKLSLIGLVALGALGVLWWWGTRARVYRNVPLRSLRRYVWSLLAQMGPGGFLVAERRGGMGFLQLAMRRAASETYTVEFGLPDIDWSTGRFETLRASMVAHRFEPSLEPGTGQVSRFLRVLVTGTSEEVIDRALALFELVATGLGWGDSPSFDVHFGGPLDVARIRARNAAVLRGRGA
jgi:hypothetical protein